MGFRWIRADEQVIQTRYLSLIEKELAYYRGKADSERNRGDRLADDLLIRNGEMPVTDLGVGDLKERQAAGEALWKTQQQQLIEIYGDAMEEAEADGLELPPEVAEEAKKLEAAE